VAQCRNLVHFDAAVHIQGLSGDVPGVVGGQEGDGHADVFGGLLTAEGAAVGDVLVEMISLVDFFF